MQREIPLYTLGHDPLTEERGAVAAPSARVEVGRSEPNEGVSGR